MGVVMLHFDKAQAFVLGPRGPVLGGAVAGMQIDRDGLWRVIKEGGVVAIGLQERLIGQGLTDWNAEDTVGLVRPTEFVPDDIEMPTADARDFLGFFQVGFAEMKSLLRALAFGYIDANAEEELNLARLVNNGTPTPFNQDFFAFLCQHIVFGTDVSVL